MTRMNNKIALITGAAGGIGSAIAERFAAEGARVLVADLDERGGKTLVEGIRNQAGEAEFFALDVTSRESWDQAVAYALEKFGGLTTLANVAGILHVAGLFEETREGWDRILAVNQTAIFHGSQACLDALVASGNGAIVNISSLWGLRGSPKAFAYHASKGAVRMMSKAAAAELGRYGIRVNTIFPGSIKTPMSDNADMSPEQKKRSDEIHAALLLGRQGLPEDIAYAALYFASDEARYVTGAELWVDGGWNTV